MNNKCFNLKTGKGLLLALMGVLLSACSPVSTFKNMVDPPASWEFIQSVGGISVGQPRVVDGIFWLPLNLDLSGQRQITVAPTQMNSGKKCLSATLRQADGLTTPVGYYDLYLQVYAGSVDKRGAGGCDEVPMFIGSLSPPLSAPNNVTFRIWYKDYVFSEYKLAEVKLQ